jgi:hypothetical protein
MHSILNIKQMLKFNMINISPKSSINSKSCSFDIHLLTHIIIPHFFIISDQKFLTFSFFIIRLQDFFYS